MKPHDAVVLALAAWYLMLPPPLAHMSPPVDFDAPLSEWRLVSVHDSVVGCVQELLASYRLAKTELLANPTDENDRIQFNALENSQCIASDNPRLKQQ